MQNIEETIQYYENLDSSDFPQTNPQLIQELRKRKQAFLKNQEQLGLDNDVAYWLSHQNNDIKQRINDTIRRFMISQNANG